MLSVKNIFVGAALLVSNTQAMDDPYAVKQDW
jgi:hypothetical protein